MLGSNVALYELLAAGATGGHYIKTPSLEDLFASGSYSLGKNVFTVGGNIVSRFLADVRTGDDRYDAESKAGLTAKLITDTLGASILKGELSFGEPVLAPGIHLMSGMSGGDSKAIMGK